MAEVKEVTLVKQCPDCGSMDGNSRMGSRTVHGQRMTCRYVDCRSCGKELSAALRYGSWAARPEGYAMDTARCIEEILEPGRAILFRQCGNKRGKGPDGLYCGRHGKWAAERIANTSKEAE